MTTSIREQIDAILYSDGEGNHLDAEASAIEKLISKLQQEAEREQVQYIYGVYKSMNLKDSEFDFGEWLETLASQPQNKEESTNQPNPRIT